MKNISVHKRWPLKKMHVHLHHQQTGLLLFTWCSYNVMAFSSRSYGPPPPPVFLPPPPPPRIQPIHAIADLANAIGNTLLKDISKFGCNSAVSPFGAITALLLLWEGTGGPSFSQVDHALGLDVRNWDRGAIRIGYRDLHRHLRGYLSHKNFLSGIKLSNPRTTVKSEYYDLLRFYGYNLEVLGVENSTTITTSTTPTSTTSTTTSTTTTSTTTPTITTSTTTPTITTTSGSTTTTTPFTIVETTPEDNNPPKPITTQETTTNEIIIETTETLTNGIDNNQSPTTVTTMGTENVEIIERQTPDVTTTTPIPEVVVETTPIPEVVVETTPIPEVVVETTPILEVVVETTPIPEVVVETTEESLIQFPVEITTITTTKAQGEPTTEEVTDIQPISEKITEIMSTLPVTEQITTTTMEIPTTTNEQIITTEIETPLPSTPPPTTIINEVIDSTEPQTITETNDPIVFPTANFRSMRSLSFSTDKKWYYTPSPPLNFRNSINFFQDDFFPFKQWNRFGDDDFFSKWWHPTTTMDPSRNKIDPPRTLLRHFFIPNEKAKLVSMMIYSGLMPYSGYIHALKGTSALVLPLDDDRYNLLILLPKQTMNVDELVGILPKYPLRKILNSLALTRVQSMVPSFRSQGIVDLTPSLNKHGICDVFEEERANLTRMSLEQNLHVYHIEQEVIVTIRHYVDIIDVESRIDNARGPPELFIADRPFVYYVVDKMTKVALVIGKMENPLRENLCNI